MYLIKFNNSEVARLVEDNKLGYLTLTNLSYLEDSDPSIYSLDLDKILSDSQLDIFALTSAGYHNLAKILLKELKNLRFSILSQDKKLMYDLTPYSQNDFKQDVLMSLNKYGLSELIDYKEKAQEYVLGLGRKVIFVLQKSMHQGKTHLNYIYDYLNLWESLSLEELEAKEANEISDFSKVIDLLNEINQIIEYSPANT